jgi:hypothetical protein
VTVRRDERWSAPRGLTAIDGALALIGVVLVVQMWLVTATLESWLAGRRDAAVPGAIFAAVLFAAVLALYRFVARVDRESRRPRD